MAEERNILKDLETNKEYTGEQIHNFLAFNESAIVISYNNEFDRRSRNDKFKVASVEETFIHQHVYTGKEMCYNHPAHKSKIYFVSKI